MVQPPPSRRGRRTRCASRTAPCRLNSPSPRDSNRSISAAVMTGRGHALVDRRQHRPPALAGVGDPAGEVVELGRAGQRVGDRGRPATSRRREPRRHTSATSADVDLVLVGLGIAQRRGLRVDERAVAVPASACLMMLSPSAMAAIIPYSIPLWTIFTKWPAPLGPAVQIALGRGPVGRVRPGVRLGAPGAGRDGAEDRVQPRHRLVLAADHQAVAPLEAEDAARGPAVDVVDAARRELLRPGDVVPVVRVAAVDHGVVRRRAARPAGPVSAARRRRAASARRSRGFSSLATKSCERGGADRALLLELLHGLRGRGRRRRTR